MYDTRKLSPKARIDLEAIMYSGIKQKMDYLKFHLENYCFDSKINNQYAVVDELVKWYCENVITSGRYLECRISDKPRIP